MRMTQVKLVRRDEEQRSVETTLWLPADKRLHKGTTLTLKGEEEWWTVAEVYATKERKSIHHDWKVGGLGGCVH